MKNNFFLIIIIVIQFLWINQSYAKQVEFKAKDIEIIKDKNLTIANDASVIIVEDSISIKGKKIEYYKDKQLLLVNDGIVLVEEKNLKIESDKISYDIDKSTLDLEGDIKIIDQNNNLAIYSNKINYSNYDETIKSENNSKITDNLGNVYQVENFEYSLDKKIIKLKNVKVLDYDDNNFSLDLAYLDLQNKELIAKDVNFNFKTPDGTENEPRLKGLSLVSNKNSTIVKKGTFTL